jgi:hypothetical protein
MAANRVSERAVPMPDLVPEMTTMKAETIKWENEIWALAAESQARNKNLLRRLATGDEKLKPKTEARSRAKTRDGKDMRSRWKRNEPGEDRNEVNQP